MTSSRTSATCIFSLTTPACSCWRQLKDLSEEYWDETLATNLKAPFFHAQAAAKHFIKRGGGGKIVNITSIWAEVGFPLFSAYCAAKGRTSVDDTRADVRVGSVWNQRQRRGTDA